jgi:hypothetical protein
MTTTEVFTLAISSSEAYTQLDYLDKLTNFIRQCPDGQLAIGAPAQAVHALKSYCGQQQELRYWPPLNTSRPQRVFTISSSRPRAYSVRASLCLCW